MKKPALLFLLLLIIGCNEQQKESSPRFASPVEMIEWIRNPSEDYVMVVAHRGYWRSAPENSILAVKHALEEEIDIVEIDVRMTMDGELVVIHDKILDRTTSGKGRISETTLYTVKQAFLKTGVGVETHYKDPTLKEMMTFVAGKPILVNLDKCWEYLPEAYGVLKETNTINQTLFKGNDPLEVLREKYGSLMDSIHYMPMVWPSNYNIYANNVSEEPVSYVDEFLTDFSPIGFEVIYDTEDSPVISTISKMQNQSVAVWVNTLWPELCGGHYDEMALQDPEAHWGWVIDHGANIIQSDRPVLLTKYLRVKGLH